MQNELQNYCKTRILLNSKQAEYKNCNVAYNGVFYQTGVWLSANVCNRKLALS
ncbi:hypothetical protein LSI01_16750 [Furfurilactobacillus siliginis]|uniref:Uncharacterized protein n=1 Tax=Furfurilactobacillus siliginis TaxID=348151 RepID=A0A510VQY6_9LACO|nr:hypothetical protein LSI01_16750 [Furfurilactobacillus siliginis]